MGKPLYRRSYNLHIRVFPCWSDKVTGKAHGAYSAISGQSSAIRISFTCSFRLAGTLAKVLKPLTIKVAYTTAKSFTPFPSNMEAARSSIRVQKLFHSFAQFGRNVFKGFQPLPNQICVYLRHPSSPLSVTLSQAFHTLRKVQVGCSSYPFPVWRSCRLSPGCIHLWCIGSG